MNKDKELEEAIKEMKSLSPSENAIETVLQALKDKENKINKCIETIKDLKAGRYIKGEKEYMPSSCCNARLDIIQELLEGK